MHELSLMSDLMCKIESIAREHGAARVTGVKVQLGALSHISPDHFREHFVRTAHETIAEGARLEIETLTDMADPQVQEVLLQSVELEE